MDNQKLALVTGGNRGIGLAMVDGLSKMGFTVLMGTRDFEKGNNAKMELAHPELIEVLELDVTKESSVAVARNKVAKEYGKLDVLINNAGIIGSGQTTLTPENLNNVGDVMNVNYFGVMRMNAYFLPLLKESGSGRIINVSSGMGALDDLVNGYTGYRLSKAGINSQTILMANQLNETDIRVFAMCPGWVRTDMGGHNAPRSAEEGADTAIWLATTEEAASGKFYRNREVIPW